MTIKPIISVIVPIYNVEPYLERCLESICDQTLKNIEIICIDDCSPDNSHEIVKKYQKKDPRIRLIRHKKNKGLGGARNTGILAANADFISGVDSDDTIALDMMEQLWLGTKNGYYDIVCCGYDEVDEGGEVLRSSNLTAIEYNNSSIDLFTTFNPAFWNKIWRRTLFVENNIYFPEHLFYEDLATTPLLLVHTNNIKIIESRLYNYYQRENAITSTFTAKHILDFFKVFEIIQSYLLEHNLYDQNKKGFIVRLNESMRWYSENVIKSGMKESEINQHLRYLLMFKVSFIENQEHLKTQTNEALVHLLKTSLKLPSEIQPLQLNKAQLIGCEIFGLFFRPFIKPDYFVKLNETPVDFFRDSKNSFTVFFGKLLRIS